MSRVIIPGSPWAPVLERMELLPVSSGNLGLGFYDNLQLVDYMVNTTVQTQAGAGLGTWSIFNTGAALNFTVNPSVTRMMVYRPLNTSRDDLRVSLSGSCTPFTVDVVGVAPDPMWNIPQTIALNGCTNVSITRVNVSGRTQNPGVDGIRLLGNAVAVNPGTYHTADMMEHFYGRAGEIANANAQQGRAVRLFDGLFTFPINPAVDSVVLYRNNVTSRDSIRIRTLNCGTSTPQNQVFGNTDPTGIWGHPIVLSNIGDCTTLEISRVIGSGGMPILESITLYQQVPPVLGLGFYDNLELASTFTNSTIAIHPLAGLGTWHRLDTGGSMVFTIDPSIVKRIMVYRPLELSRDDLRVNFTGSCTPFFVDVVGVAPDAMWNIPNSMFVNGCNTVTITRRFIRPDAAGVDGIALLADPLPLGVGTYHTADLVEHIYGRNGEVKNANAQDGRAVRLMDATFTFEIASNVHRLVLYRHNLDPRNPIRIRTQSCSVPGDAQDVQFTSPNVAGVWGSPIIVDNIGTCTRIEITRVIIPGSPWSPVLERMVLLADPQPPLTSGNLYQEYDTGLVYGGVWNATEVTDAPSKRMLFTNALNASVSFTMTGNGFIVYHRAGAGTSNNVEVCVTTGSNTYCTNYSTQNATLIPQFPIGIYGLGNGTHTVTITNKQGGGNLFIDAIRVP